MNSFIKTFFLLLKKPVEIYKNILLRNTDKFNKRREVFVKSSLINDMEIKRKNNRIY